MASTERTTAPNRHPSVSSLLEHIRRPDIPEGHPQYPVVRSVSYTAHELADLLPEGGAELSVTLRKLLEAQDAALRCGTPRGPGDPLGVQPGKEDPHG